METENKLKYLKEKIKELAVFRNVLEDPVILSLLDFISAEDSLEAGNFGKLYWELLAAHETDRFYTPNAWKNHLINLIIWDDNPVTRQGTINGQNLSDSWRKALCHDLIILEELFNLEKLVSINDKFPLLSWENLQVGPKNFIKHHKLTLELVEYMLSGKDWTKELNLFLLHYKKLGVGLFGKYHALYWDGRAERFCGVINQDKVTFLQLIGYEKERQRVILNTIKFLKGYPANNVLLYGDRGTGKSSTVKALVNEYSHLGLRIIELKKNYLCDFPVIVRQLSVLPYKFLIFLDDLSFEEHEVEYKALKGAFEGGLEARPANVLVYATSNRRHIIRESFTQREDDIHKRDTIEEKMSLADRFGLQVAFQSPDQVLYLHIVKELAKQRQLTIDPKKLEKMATQWELRHSGRSGRLAKQFIDYLEGEESLVD